MNIYRAKHDNFPGSPIRTLYGRKGNYLLLPLDVCILQTINGKEEFRPSSDATRMIAAPVQDAIDGRVGTVARYEWPPLPGCPANPIVTVQIAPSANVKGVEDLRVIAAQAAAGDAVVCSAGNVEGVIVQAAGWCTYPELTHRVEAFRVEFSQPMERQAHGVAVHLKNGQLVSMLIATGTRTTAFVAPSSTPPGCNYSRASRPVSLKLSLERKRQINEPEIRYVFCQIYKGGSNAPEYDTGRAGRTVGEEPGFRLRHRVR